MSTCGEHAVGRVVLLLAVQAKLLVAFATLPACSPAPFAMDANPSVAACVALRACSVARMA